jgi:hypothetical protein
MQFLNLIAIINQSFLTAFSSQWSKSYYTNDDTLNRFIYVVVFEVEELFLILKSEVSVPKTIILNEKPCSYSSILQSYYGY